jgi:beta-phosphoglucomutase-like phosphatase (HAD superfamily)
VNFDLIIFDCDGVLVDSEVISCRAHAETLTRHGYPITAEQVLERFLGVSDREARQTIEREMGRELPDDFEAQMKQAALQRYTGELGAIPNIGEAIDPIKLPKCVASSGTPEKIRHGLTCAGLYDQLAPHIFSATQVSRGKPAPDLFLFAAEQMKAQPARPGDRGQRSRRHGRLRRRNDLARFPRWQPLSAGPCRDAARRRCHLHLRRYANAARSDRAHRSKERLDSHRIAEVRHAVGFSSSNLAAS